MHKIPILLAWPSIVLPFVKAQSPVWGQCGGQGWTGPTTCVAGSACVVQNPYYSQCLPVDTTSSTPTSSSTTSAPTSTGTAGPHGETLIWFNQPASAFTDTIVIGNGQLGASIWGDPASDRFGLNQETVWAGGPYDPSNPTALQHLAQVRQLVNSGNYSGAQSVLDQYSMATPLRQVQYQTVGSLYLNFNINKSSVTNYRRQLDLAQAVATTSYTYNGVNFQRTAFVSRPLNVMVVRLTASANNALSFSANLGTPTSVISNSATTSSLTLTARNTAGGNGIAGVLTYQVRTRIILEGGSITTSGSSVTISNANAVTFVLGAASSFQKYNDVSGNPSSKLDAVFSSVPSSFNYASVLSAHIADYQSMFNRFSIDLGSNSSLSALPTNQRVARGMNPVDTGLISLFINFGRYLLISSSAPGSIQPATLQGIWQPDTGAAWDSKYTVNINLEMNYWPAEVTSLQELMDPVTRLMEDVSVTGRRTAQVMWGASSSSRTSGGIPPYVLHHNTDQWRATAPIDGAVYGYWPTGAVWVLQTLWDHYDFNPSDTSFARRIYPLFQGSSQFFLETLQTYVNNTNWLVTNPSMSPEKTHPGSASIAPGPTIDNALLRDLFAQTVTLASLLGVDSSFRTDCTNARGRLPPYLIGRGGQLQEWLVDWDSTPSAFNHISPLYGLYPSNQIDPRLNSTLANAAKVLLGFRGDGGEGWPIAWRIGTWARLLDASHTMTEVKLLLSDKGVYGSLLGKNMIITTHSSVFIQFQIDANLGGTGTMIEMFLQSHNGILHLLPALPSELSQGTITGLRARGGYTVRLSWSGGRLSQAVVTATIDNARTMQLQMKVCMLKHDLLGTAAMIKAPRFRLEDSHCGERQARGACAGLGFWRNVLQCQFCVRKVCLVPNNRILDQGQQDELALFARGKGGLAELRNYLEGLEQVLLGFLHEVLDDGSLVNVLISYVPTTVSGVRRARALVHSRYLATIFKKHDGALNVERSSQLTPNAIYQIALAEPGRNTHSTVVTSRSPPQSQSHFVQSQSLPSRVQQRSASLPTTSTTTSSETTSTIPIPSSSPKTTTTITSTSPTTVVMGKAFSQPVTAANRSAPSTIPIQPIRRAVSDRHDASSPTSNHRPYHTVDYRPPPPATGSSKTGGSTFSNFIRRRKDTSEHVDRYQPDDAPPLPPPKDFKLAQHNNTAPWNVPKLAQRQYSTDMVTQPVYDQVPTHAHQRSLSPDGLQQLENSLPRPTKPRTLSPMPSFPLRDKWLAEHGIAKDPAERARLRMEAQRKREMEERQALEEEERRQIEKRRMKEEQEKQERLEEEMRKIKLEEEFKRIAADRRRKEQQEKEEEERKKREFEEKKRLEKQRRLEEHKKLEEWRAAQNRLAEAAARRAEEERKREDALKRSKIMQIEKRIKRNTKSEFLLTGWVTMQTTNSLVWKRRFYRLAGDTFYFYRSPKDMHQILETVSCRGAISALREWNEGYEELEAIPHSFVIEFTDDRGSWSMYADSEEEKHLGRGIAAYVILVCTTSSGLQRRPAMAGLISPKPVSYLQHGTQYNNYARGISAYSETPPLPSAPALGLPGPHQAAGSYMPNATIGPGPGIQEDNKIYQLVIDLTDPANREAALLELSKKREQYDDLALVLWHSFGIMPALLQEIVSVYPLLSPPNLTAHVSNRVCNALALLQCVASHSETRQLFLNAHIPLFLYPFLNTTSKTRPFEYLRLTSLGVIGALVKQNDNNTVIHFLLSTEIIPLCLRIMETGSELSKTVAIFIVQKILLDETGLTYICHTYERFYAVGTVLSNMVHQLVETQAVRLLKHVVRCYLRLSDNMRAREALRACLPEPLRDQTFAALLKGDMVTKRCLTTLLNNLNEP
ncbi:hypothetical protein AX16_001462 [Volvariella volvacea WC 439]|nr:hypothetical protein AX16_001462 [Volvariella volvacea WC 439]